MMSDTAFAELGLKVLPSTRSRAARGAASMSLRWYGDRLLLAMTKAARETAGIETPGYVQVMVGRGVIAVRAAKPTDAHARRLPRTGTINVPDLRGLLDVPKGTPIAFPVEFANGHAIARIPANLIAKGGK